MVIVVDNYINGKIVPPSSNDYLDVTNPANNAVIGKVALSTTVDVEEAIVE